jgi:chemotaxis protein MotB
MAEHNDPPIIRIVKKGHGHAHHGGAWKVAFADFVTAMMALFIVLWILGQSEDVKRGIGGYFRDPTGKALLGAGPADGPASKSMIRLPTIMERYSMPDPEMVSEADKLEEVIEQSEALSELKDQISIEVSQEGLRVEINEGAEDPLFESGSADMTPKLKAALEALSKEYVKLPYKIIVEGHTDATPFRSETGMTNWELSTLRANQARSALESGGLPDDQVLMVRGFADRRPRFEDALDPRNRRISMLLVSSQGMDIALGNIKFAGIEDNEIPAPDPEEQPKRNRVTLFATEKNR